MPESFSLVGDRYLLTHGQVQLLIAPAEGGRIASARHAGQEMLVTEDQHSTWGNVFWTSPQSDWGWPPLPELDSDAYAVAWDGDALVLTSAVAAQLPYQVRKRYSASRRDNEIVVEYRLYNRGADTRRVAPWEITRVAASGLAFFPKGDSDFISGPFQDLPVEVIEGVVWFDYRPERILPGHHKLMTDGAEGWLAWVNDGYLLLKLFDDVPVAYNAPGEGEVEIFANEDRRYIELEQQGPYTELAPDEYVDWRVRWLIVPLPAGFDAVPGDSRLLQWVRTLID